MRRLDESKRGPKAPSAGVTPPQGALLGLVERLPTVPYGLTWMLPPSIFIWRREARERVVGARRPVPDPDRVRVGPSARARARLAVVGHVDVEVVVAAEAVRDAGRPVHGGDVVLALEARVADLRRRGRAGLGESNSWHCS